MTGVIGKTVTVTVDRPLGSVHPRHGDIRYPINYGYIAGVPTPDGEDQDAYILGVDRAIASFTGKVIAVIHRYDKPGAALSWLTRRPSADLGFLSENNPPLSHREEAAENPAASSLSMRSFIAPSALCTSPAAPGSPPAG